MEIKSREQREFEEWAQVLIRIFANLSPESRKEVVNYAIYKNNIENDE